MSESKDAVRVVVYGKPDCKQCDATKTYLDKQGTQYEYRDITEEGIYEAAVRSLGYTGVPVVAVYKTQIDPDTHWHGFRPDRIKALAS